MAPRVTPILLLLAAYLFFGGCAIDDFGLTWDEGVKIHDDDSYGDIWRRIEPYDPRVLHIPGYFYAFDTARSLYAKALRDLVPGADVVRIHHSFNLLVSAACLALLYLLVLRISASVRLAILSALSLCLMPQFLGHSQNNPKDLPAMFCFLLVAWLVVRAGDVPDWRRAAAAALAFGVSLTTRLLSALLVPILGIWLLARRREVLLRHRRAYGLGLLAACAAAIASWPALWIRGPEILEVARRRFGVLQGLDVQVLYLGQLHSWRDLPWHFSLVQLLITLPLALLVPAAIAPLAVRAWHRTRPRACDALWLAFLWVGILLVSDLFAPLHYDGIRHLLAVLPAVAILAAGGIELVVELLARSVRHARGPLQRIVPWSPALLAGVTILEIAAVHPYETAYLNPIANALAPSRSEEWVEVEYWGAPYKEGIEWLRRNAEPDAEIYLPLGGGQRSGEDISRFYLGRPTVRDGTFEEFQDTAKPRYLIFVTRRAWYDDLIRQTRAHYDPVYRIRRQRATLLEIYSNRTGRRGRLETAHP